MRTITVHCFNDDGYNYEFEMQAAIDKDGDEIKKSSWTKSFLQ